MIIIGITGTLGAGKGTIVDYLTKVHGFRHFSARNFIAKEIEKRGLIVNRNTLVAVANDLRTTYHPGYIVTELYKQAWTSGKDAVIESIRAEGEVLSLCGKDNFYLFAVDADSQKRYDRILRRASETDNRD